MPFQIPTPLKIAIPLISLAVMVVVLKNINSDDSFEQYFFGSDKGPQNAKNPSGENIRQEIAQLPGRWAVAIRHLKTDKTYFYNENEEFTSASLYKLAVMWAAFDALENGSLTEGEVISERKAKLDEILEGKQNRPIPIPNVTPKTTHPEEEIISYTVSEALKLMITISDNYSALLLAEKLGWENIDRLMKAENLDGVDLLTSDNPTITAKSTTDLLERIYRKTAVSQKSSVSMENLLLAQQLNDRIPKYLPEGIKVAHKTAELNGLRHDAAIIFGQKSDYIFVFLTQTESPEAATETIARLSQKIFASLERP